MLLCFAALLLGIAIWFAAGLGPVGGEERGIFRISEGQGFREVADNLSSQGFARDPLATKIYLLFSGKAFHLQPGAYLLGHDLKVPEIAAIIGSGVRQSVRVTVPEGSSLYDIDGILSENYILEKGKFISWAKTQSTSTEGYLFPDTYDFFLESNPQDVAKVMRANFDSKAKSILEKDPKHFTQNLILASILEKEVPDYKDRQIVAGILLKRISAGMPLQVDATICYMKKMDGADSCYPLSPLDFKERSPYNTYINRGFPPGPIGNPGVEAIQAAMAPIKTAYWYYLSDPATGKTVWSETLDTHASNRAKYLKK